MRPSRTVRQIDAMDIVAVLLGIVVFMALAAIIEGIDRI